MIEFGLFDLETDGLLDEVTTIHCIVLRDLSTGLTYSYHDDPAITPRNGSIEDGLEAIQNCEVLVGHNILEYDCPVLEKLHDIKWDPRNMHDTAVMSRLAFSDRKERDFKLHAKGKMEGRYIGQHSLGAWGHRFGFPKGSWDDWSEFSQGMLDYCIRDIDVNEKLYHFLMKNMPTYNGDRRFVLEMEHRFAHQLFQQERRGAYYDQEAANELLGELIIRRAELLEIIRKEFPDRIEYYKRRINKETGLRTGPRVTRYCPHREGTFDHKLVPFNPNSRQQLAARLIEKHDWVPKELSKKTLKPLMHEQILLELADVYPEVAVVAEFYIVESRISMLQEGKNSYAKLCDEDSRIHGRTLHIGTVTHRCAHSKPNLGNVTSVRKPYGLAMRGLFRAYPGMIQAGWDADGLELRMLAHYLFPYDGGEYRESVLNGRKEDGTDSHSRHARAISLVVPTKRDDGKNITYAFLYGAGDRKLGKMRGGGNRLGKKIRESMETNINGLGPLIKDIQAASAQRGYLVSLDNRRVGIRRPHAALNTLLQTAGAVVMRYVPVIAEDRMNDLGVRYGLDYLQTGHVHDECQGSLLEELKEPFSLAVDQAFAEVTELLNLNCPVSGTAEFGETWADTH